MSSFLARRRTHRVDRTARPPQGATQGAKSALATFTGAKAGAKDVDTLINQIGDFLNGIFGLASVGFDGVNQVMGLIIAVIAALMMAGWRALGSTALGATLTHLIVLAVLPVLNGGDFALPDVLSVGFWMRALALFLGYAIVIAIFFFIKTLLTGAAFGRRVVR